MMTINLEKEKAYKKYRQQTEKKKSTKLTYSFDVVKVELSLLAESNSRDVFESTDRDSIVSFLYIVLSQILVCV